MVLAVWCKGLKAIANLSGQPSHQVNCDPERNRDYTSGVKLFGAMSELPPLNTDTLWAILNDTIDDSTVNRLVWHCLGYRYNKDTSSWDLTNVESSWRDEYPEPPDFIASRPATVKLTRSIPAANKQLLKEKLGFAGYKVGELVPRRTRRATAVNWLLSYMQDQGAAASE